MRLGRLQPQKSLAREAWSLEGSGTDSRAERRICGTLCVDGHRDIDRQGSSNIFKHTTLCKSQVLIKLKAILISTEVFTKSLIIHGHIESHRSPNRLAFLRSGIHSLTLAVSSSQSSIDSWEKTEGATIDPSTNHGWLTIMGQLHKHIDPLLRGAWLLLDFFSDFFSGIGRFKY